ncbi:hypothetical protein [Tatumella citrea]|uniref:Uncharacterized protein n=1 Tax=Tatumella citrea TaxID=53336 RepID=A0A1Y0LPN2_TATCI|nr:hypothetical protein [Tatumella citrea]ARU95468.1 hypothetical protein A7K98_17990 [Tatumella citrea]ARU99509.1 hypothetical protein A7K99_17975 [Tatumella citrea]
MKISTLAITAILISPSFSLFAAQLGSEPSGPFGRELGTISISGINGDMDDTIHVLKIKRTVLAAHQINIISLDSPGKSDAYLGATKIFSRYC